MTRARDLAAGTFELATGGVLKLETSDTTVTDGSVLGKIEFKAPDEASGTDANLTAAAIEAVAEGTFAADNNATELVFKTGASAAADVKMTLTSGGNLLVGKTVQSIGTVGVTVVSGQVTATADGADALRLNRLSSDGSILDLRKAGTTVGSIGTDPSSGDFYVQSQITNHAGLGFKVNEVLPRRNGYVDGIDSLGSSTYRFANLYLSGGVFLGGTGSANKLDDYEEGTFTIGFTGASFSLGNATAIYTKVGDKVTFAYYSGSSNISSASGNAILTGLPFTVRNSDTAYSPFVTTHNTFFGGVANTGATGHVSKNVTTGRFLNVGTTTVSSFVNGNGKYIMITGTYFTDS